MAKKVSRPKSGARKSRVAKTASKARAKAGAKAKARSARKAPSAKRPSVKRTRAAKTAKRTARKAGSASSKAAASRARFAPETPAGDVVVTVGESHRAGIKKVAAKLRSRGMKVNAVLESTGHITGSLPKSRSSLEGVNGVAAVEKSPQFQLPPPDSDVQ